MVVLWGQRRRWHDRWLGYRALAETLRHLRFLGLLGQYEKHSWAEAAAHPGSGWLLWYLGRQCANSGFPPAISGRNISARSLTAVAAAELDAQIDYHADNMEALSRLHHRLHREGDLCFPAAFGILLVFLLTKTFGGFEPFEAWFRWRPLPALGAAFAGIRFTGDLDGLALRSAETGAELDVLRGRYRPVLDHLDFDIPAQFVFSIARTMAVDISG